jgi:hypothetical protein
MQSMVRALATAAPCNPTSAAYKLPSPLANPGEKNL